MRSLCVAVALVVYAHGTPDLNDAVCSSAEGCSQKIGEATSDDLSSLLQTATKVVKDKEKQHVQEQKTKSQALAETQAKEDTSRKAEDSAKTKHVSQSLSDEQKHQAQALHNYEQFYGKKAGSATLAEIRRSAAGIEGWARFHEVQEKNKHAQPQGFLPFLEPIEVSMARMANDVYKSNKRAGAFDLQKYGWIRDMHFDIPSDTGLEEDRVGLYRNTDKANPVCVLAFAGSNSVLDFSSNAYAFSGQYCHSDKGFQQGFVNELENLRNMNKTMKSQAFDGMEIPGWPALEMRMNEHDCSDQIWVVGHSLGAALAEIFAYCTNSDTDYYVYSPVPPIHRIYTFGGPASTQEQLTNSKSPDGCFGGKRFYNMDGTWGDAVASLANPFGYVHPRYETVRLREMSSWWGSPSYSTEVYACTSNGARVEPDNWHIMSPAYHLMDTYVLRTKKVYGDPIGD